MTKKSKPVDKNLVEKKTSEKKSLEDKSKIPVTEKLFPIIGIGASAGGLEALESFFKNIPANTGMAFVIIQHLDPTHKGIMPELIQRSTGMKVLPATDQLRVKPDCIYVIPSNKSMSILRRTLYLFDPVETRGLRLPIDFFFTSLAEDLREQGIGIVLSGMGSDGSAGVRTIKERGGLVMVQDPESAKFDGMPRSAMNAVPVDVIASAEDLPHRLVSFFSNKPVIADSPGLIPKEKSALDKILILLRMQTGHDFTDYKNNTLYRRIERRMGVHQLLKISAYVRFLQENPKEVDILFQELLIGVTSFFRDVALWEELGNKTLPALLNKLPKGYIVRAWVVGCSTGEEAYTLAMIFKETIDKVNNHNNISLQIFATDIDSMAIDKARKGYYADYITSDVNKERLNRFFIKSDEGYRIKTEIREMVVFAPQNVIKDPPFTKLDILSCRNLLIYLDTELQKKLLSLFHYCLNPSGILILGSAETPGMQSSLFSPVNTKLRIFHQIPNKKIVNIFDFPSSFSVPPPENFANTQPLKIHENIQSLSDQFLLNNFAPTGVVANENGDIVYITGPTGFYLEAARGKANMNIFPMAREGLKNELSIGFRKAMHTYTRVDVKNIKIKSNEDSYLVDIVIQKMEKPDTLRGLYMVVFSHSLIGADDNIKKTKLKVNPNDSALKIVDLELQRTKDELQLTIEEMQTSQEELKSANEELQSANEELQSTNEELSTSKEEMQSLNEELQTVNLELLSKVDDYTHTNNDLKNLLDSTDLATLFLDKNLKIRRFTIETTKIFKLNQSDIGRPFTDIVSDLNYPEISDDAISVLRTLIFKETSLPTHDGRWFSVKIIPYRTTDDRIEGLVITFTDITTSKNLEHKLNSTIGALDQKLIEINKLLSEKEIILRESHHRVKNNMNVIIGLLTLQSEIMENQESQNILNDAAYRLKCMNVLYDKLYLPGNEKTLSLNEFLPTFIDEVISIFPVIIPIEVKTKIDDITLSNTAVTPVIIILNELITNSMKYAFAGRDSGIISVSALLRENRVSLIYEDNGIGLPPDLTLENSTGFGTQLIGMLADQIGGTIKIEPGKGVKFILEWDYLLPVAEDI